tara:strand:+ start:703 stop:1320 length:618 start_codon:yes stop_codon:yes gene_type:complete
MKSLMFFIFLTMGITHAQENKSDVYIVEDIIMEESLKKQGQKPQRQKQESQAMNKLKELQEQVADLKEEVTELKSQKQAMVDKVVEMQVEHNLQGQRVKGRLGRFMISEGKARAMVRTEQNTTKNKMLPALQVCATMADVNRLTKEDLIFLGMSEPIANQVLEVRNRRGQFSSSKQLNSIAGVDQELIETIRPGIMAISEQRFAE